MIQWHQTRINRSEFDSNSKRSGYTLLELVIVTAILAAAAAMAWPRVRPLLRRSSHRDAALQLKAELAEARELAVHTGQLWQFRVYPGSGRYLIGPADSNRDEEETAEVDEYRERTAHSEEQTEYEEQTRFARELPDGVIFPQNLEWGRDAADPIDSRMSDTARRWAVDGGIPAPPDDILMARLFPDGRTTEVLVQLIRPESGEMIELRLRGLTGSVTIGPVEQRSKTIERPQEDALSPEIDSLEIGSQAEPRP